MPYAHRVVYSKKFLSGNLFDLSVPTQLTFANHASAIQFAKILQEGAGTKERRDVLTGARWVVVPDSVAVEEV